MDASLNAPRRSPAQSVSGVVAQLNAWRPGPSALARAYCIVAVAMVVPYLPVLTLLHSVFIDEIHIAEYGRLFLDPQTSWSIFWDGDHGITPWYFIGGSLAELALRATSPSCIGARLLGLFGSIVASGMMMAWLWRRRTLPAAALLLGLLLLFNPLLMLSYTAGRIDGCMLSCGCAAGYLIASYATEPRAWRLFVAGCLVSLGFFVWPSVAFLVPLLGLELISANRAASRPLWRSVMIAGSGAALTFIVLGAIVLIRVPSVLSDMPKQLAVAGMVPGRTISEYARDFRIFCAHMILRAPWNLPFIYLVWRSGASRAPLGWALLPIAIMFATLLYGNRLIYVVPYLLVAFAGLFTPPEAAPTRARTPSQGPWWLLVGSVAACFVFAAVVRPVLPWLHRETRSETLLFTAAESAAPRSSTVCLHGSAIEFYLVGRSRDWRMFMLTPDTLANCDSAIVQPTDVVPELAARFEAAGFHRETTLLADLDYRAPAWEQHVYGYYRYGPYEVYRRATRASANTH